MPQIGPIDKVGAQGKLKRDVLLYDQSVAKASGIAVVALTLWEDAVALGDKWQAERTVLFLDAVLVRSYNDTLSCTRRRVGASARSSQGDAVALKKLSSVYVNPDVPEAAVRTDARASSRSSQSARAEALWLGRQPAARLAAAGAAVARRQVATRRRQIAAR